MTTKREMKEIKSILDLFLSQTNGDEVISQERIEWELDFRTHLLNEIQRNFISREKVEEVIEKIMESHNHNSIPSYTADLEEGCSICIKNQAFLDLRQELLE